MFNGEKGFLPISVTDAMASYYQFHVAEWDQEGLTLDRFEGSKEYELYYTAAQVDVQQQAFYAQTFEKLKNYITVKNQKIVRPTPINDRIIDHFQSKYGFITSVRQPTIDTRGILAICIDYTRSTELDNAIANDIKTYCLLGGIHTFGDITANTALSNGQSFPMSWTRPTERTVDFKYTIIRSRNSEFAELPIIDIRKMILDNFAERNSQGLDVEPQKYLTLADLPWASSISGERKLDGEMDFSATVYQAPYNEKFIATVDINNITVTD